MRTKKKLFAITASLLLVVINAQNQPGCGFNYAQEIIKTQVSDYSLKLKAFEQFQSNASFKRAALTLTIPVVVHILHLGGSENISDAQVQDAINILTRDFRKQNADTTDIVNEFKTIASDCNIEFKLASIDPDGKCTNGITRHYDSKANWIIDLAYYTYTWPPDKYLNIYVVKGLPAGTAGYTFLPGTIPVYADAIVILHNYFGSIGTGSPFGSRSLTHEVGHWLGLSHVWGNTNNVNVTCGDDGVSDTPITEGHNWCNLSNAIECTPGIVENIQNYMEYAFCSRMFTLGQSNLMNGVLASSIADRDKLVSSANMVATGILNPNYNCPPKPEFGSLNLVNCQNVTHPFIDYSYNGNITAWEWNSPAAINTSTIQNGQLIFGNSGLLPVKLKVSNSFGSDSVTKNQYITILSNNGSTVNVVQSFEDGIYPNNQWIASIPQYGSGFVQKNNAGSTGTKCMFINNYTDNPSEPAILYTPKFNLSNVSNAKLRFKYAYAQQNNNNDLLRIYASKDCGQTWNAIYNVGGSNLATRANINNMSYQIPTASEWKEQLVDPTGFQNENNVFFKFEFTPDENGPGNNFFMDDINLIGTVGLFENNLSSQIEIYPNPFQNKLEINSLGENIDKVIISDITGKELLKRENINQKHFIFSNIDLSKGVYLLKVNTLNGSFVKKIVLN